MIEVERCQGITVLDNEEVEGVIDENEAENEGEWA